MLLKSEKVLGSFNEAAEKLNSRRFLKSVRAGKATYHIQWQRGKGTRIQRKLPHPEDIESYLLTFRLFVQDNESFSLRNLAALYRTMPVSKELKLRFEAIRKSANSFLDALSPVIWHQKQLSRRHIFEVFLYGGLAHRSSVKKAEFDGWMGNSIMKVVLETEFVLILAALTQVIFNIRHLNVEALAELRAQAGI